ncbi:MAG: glycosyltransferase [Saprospiraceae bacterium]|nr:glycosyltransferase [Candidatus Vicinibacter affinis]
MKPISICITTTSDIGFDQRLQRVSNTLVELGYRVTILYRSKSSIKKSITDRYSFEHPAITLILISTWFQSSFLFYAEYNIRLLLKLMGLSPNWVYAVDADTLLVSTVFKRIKRGKLIFDAHEFFEESPEIIDKKFIRKTWSNIIHWGTAHADLCLSVAPILSEVLSKKYKVKFHSIRNLPTKKIFPNTYTDRPKVIWYQGVLNIGRGLELMIEAMLSLPEYECWIAGDGDISDQLHKLAEKLNLGARIKFFGKLTPEELALLNTKALIGINLLEGKSLNYYYSLANKTFDYIQAGLPTLHMNFPEYQNLIAEYPVGILLSECTPEEISASVKSLEDPTLYHQMFLACQQAANVLVWKNESGILVELLQNLENTNEDPSSLQPK